MEEIPSAFFCVITTATFDCNGGLRKTRDSVTNMNVGPLAILSVWRSVKFLFVGPLVLAFLFVINVATSPGHWWIQWPALGIGLAWGISLFRVLRLALIVGGIAALVSYLKKR